MLKSSKNMESKVINQKFEKFLSLKDIPTDLRISTITMTCTFDTEFNVENIARYIDLNIDDIRSVKYGNSTDPLYNRSLIVKKTRKKKTKKKYQRAKKKDYFFNNVAMYVKPKNTKQVNIKIFRNGSIQMTGCNSYENCIEAIQLLCSKMKEIKGVLNMKTLDKIEPVPYVTCPENLEISKVDNIKIRMINSNYNVNFNINRERFYINLLKQNINCSFEPVVHACVNIKYYYKKVDEISIFVFESGCIIITGAKCKDHIKKAYEFITKKLYENYHDIIIHNIDKILKRKDIKQLIKEKSNNFQKIKYECN